MDGQSTYQYVSYVDGEYKLVTEEIPQPGAGKVLIKISYTTVNPHDRYVITTK